MSAEDAGGELAKAVRALDPLADRDVLDVGAGTGRLSRLLLEAGARVTAIDAAPAMLEVARRELARFGERVRIEVGDARELPFPDQSFDLVIAGWVFGHFRYWNDPGWKDDITRALGEMRRVARAGASLLIIETLGTGSELAAPPDPRLAEYYAWLESEQGFVRQTIATDYEFADAARAAELVGFFFGPELGGRVQAARSSRVQEWTGIWSCRTPSGKV